MARHDRRVPQHGLSRRRPATGRVRPRCGAGRGVRGPAEGLEAVPGSAPDRQRAGPPAGPAFATAVFEDELLAAAATAEASSGTAARSPRGVPVVQSSAVAVADDVLKYMVNVGTDPTFGTAYD